MCAGGKVFPYRRERRETPDGDFLDLDWLPAGVPRDRFPLVLVLHGLEGSSQAKYVTGLMKEVRLQAWDGVAMNFRFCSGEPNRLPRFYHSGETGDLDLVASGLAKEVPGRPIVIVGYSLGGNVLLKWLGERGEKVPPEVLGAVAISVPFDLQAAVQRIDQGILRLYGRLFLRTLKRKALLKAKRFPSLLDSADISAIQTFAQFDDRVTAPLHGFTNGLDYWRQSSSGPFLHGIRRPTLLISACDDPFLPKEYLPWDVVKNSRIIRAEFPERGGHVGFVEGKWPGRASYWVDRRIIRFLRSLLPAERINSPSGGR